MKVVLVLLFWGLAQAAFAQTVVVKSGDHPGFTRLVLELPQPADWEMGRTGEGYELRLKTDGIRFDLTGVFDQIQRNRLAAIWMDPASGGLRLGVACACHAMPFEFRPGIIVVDLRDGPPPKGSSFELALDGSRAADLAARPSPRPRARPHFVPGALPSDDVVVPAYSWIAASKPAAIGSPVNGPLPSGLTVPEPNDIGPLKDALLRQLGRGAAQGIVQMAQPSLSARKSGDPLPTGPRASIHLGAAPGFDVTTKRGPENLLITDGADCVADDRLDLAAWGSDLPVSIQLADARANLIGEFDRPDPDAVIMATKLLINVGFGAEARQLLTQMPVDTPDSAILTSMAKLVDGASDADGPFKGMLTCDTVAALWAVLALPQLSPAHHPRTEAVLRAFSALPAHLRRALGPDLAAKFLVVDDLATAQALKNAVLRAVQDPTPEIAIMEAGIDLASGNPIAASAHLEPVLAEAGPATADALIALVDAALAAGEVVSPETAIALAALVREQAGSDLDPALRRAHILALGSSGDFDQAFALLPQMPGAEPDLWALLAGSGRDAAILDHAVLPPDARMPALAVQQRQQIAAQLLTLGLAGPALMWIGAPARDSAAEDRILAATARLLAGDAAGALAGIDGIEGAAAADLRAQALTALGKPAEAAAEWAVAGNSAAELRAQSWARDWDGLAQKDASAWQPAATLASMAPVRDAAKLPGPLARGNALVADSTKARATVIDLLGGVPGPAPTPAPAE